jgi:regulator of protease activity HflC (stomatin/prohibitin superfamily)
MRTAPRNGALRRRRPGLAERRTVTFLIVLEREAKAGRGTSGRRPAPAVGRTGSPSSGRRIRKERCVMGVLKLWHRIKIDEMERGLLFRDGALVRLLGPGRHFLADPGRHLRIEKVSIRRPWLVHNDLEMIVKSGVLDGQAMSLDLKDHERSIVWIDGRIDAVCGPGLHAIWTILHRVQVEVIETRGVRFEHPDLSVILNARGASALLEPSTVAAGWVALVYQNGRLAATLEPGVHAFWRGEGDLRIFHVDLREQTAEINGQEIMTADKVSLRLNAMVAYRVIDPVLAVTAVESFTQVLYRQAQLALRAVVGTRELDVLLSDKDGVAAELEEALRTRAAAFGLEVRTVGVRDVILPGEMRALLNRVTEARKAAEASLVTRREETAAIRSQANTARIFETNPTLMRLRELEVLEKVAEKANLSVVLGEGGLADRVVKLL